MKVDWKELWEANENIFVGSGWEECSEDKRKARHLPSQYSYFSSGDLNLRVGIVAVKGAYKEQDFLLGGILWGSRLGNGARTVIYFVAQDFSSVFLGALAKLGGALSAKAVYWREKLTPSLFPVQENDYIRSTHRIDLGELRPNWEYWERQLNPVAWNHLAIIRGYLDNFTQRRLRAVFEKDKIIFNWGSIQIVEIRKKGNKFELATKVKWTRNKNIVTRFQKSGWVDIAGNINDEFCRAIGNIIEFLENMEMNGSLDPKDLLSLRMINDKEFVPASLGKYCDCPWLTKDRNQIADTDELMFFRTNNEISIVHPILEKPVVKLMNTLLVYVALEYSSVEEKGLPNIPETKWNKKLYLLTQSNYKDELRLCQTWLKQPENYPIVLLPEDWKTEGLKGINGLVLSEFEDSLSDRY